MHILNQEVQKAAQEAFPIDNTLPKKEHVSESTFKLIQQKGAMMKEQRKVAHRLKSSLLYAIVMHWAKYIIKRVNFHYDYNICPVRWHVQKALAIKQVFHHRAIQQHNAAITRDIEADVAEHVRKNIHKIEQAAWNNDQRTFWKLLKPCYRKFTPQPHAIMDAEGDLVADPTEKKRAFQQ